MEEDHKLGRMERGKEEKEEFWHTEFALRSQSNNGDTLEFTGNLG
jgi:hypothetical protein